MSGMRMAVRMTMSMIVRMPRVIVLVPTIVPVLTLLGMPTHASILPACP